MQKIYFSIILFVFLFLSGFSQQKTKPEPDKKKIGEKLYYGGNLGLQFGNVTFIDISPLVGYKFTDDFSAGAGITYIYIRYNILNRYSTDIYGGRIFLRYNILESLFLYGEVEKLNGYWDPFINSRFFVTSVLAGGGYRQPIGERAGMNLMFLWNFNESIYSPYSNPVIRGGITIGI